MSGRKYPTANLYLKSVWKIEVLLLEYESCEDTFLRDMAKKMKVKFDKYWESYSFILSFATILDPRFKLEFVRYCFTEVDADTAETKFEDVKSELYKLFEEYVKMDPCTNESSIPTEVQDELPGFAAFANDASRVSSTELDMYLDEARLNHTLDIDILSWWKDNGKRFSTVANMARDILAIPVTTVASESAFSMGSRVITKWRASLKPETADALLTTRTWLYGFDVQEATKDNQVLDGFEYQFSALRISEENAAAAADAVDDGHNENDEGVEEDTSLNLLS
ncbi:zinc finger BED domain-containing protein DAYSLEEPER-like [Silene latifolia]|uniref:zinc finger BED domain-containing protein DAYSLEEPER-like n=1 Tax=Silene latifolia TaxID=37657 RepID=UPI003D77FA31